MQTYTWTFANSFLAFLVIVFASTAIATKLKSYLPMPLLFGVIFAAGFALGLLPEDMLLSANMVTVGTIAFNVLVIHSGTMINFHLLSRMKKEAALCIAAALGMSVVLLVVLPPLVGINLALLAPGSVVGGGASCAIGSRWSSDISPEISFFPWLIFMFQGVFSVPVVSWALKKEVARMATAGIESPAPGGGPGGKPFGLVGKIPEKYKSPAYYLLQIMLLAVINYALQGTLLKNLSINLNITALLLGMLAGNLGLIDRAPLFKCDSYGILILSLMGLMANNLAHTPPIVLLKLTAPALLALGIATVVLCANGIFLSKWMGLSPYTGLILTMNSVMGYPVNRELAEDAIKELPEPLHAPVSGRLIGLLGLSTSLISGGLSIFIISILVSFVR